MPITKSAIKKQRVDRSRAKVNMPVAGRLKSTLKIARSKPTSQTVASFYSAVDRAVKKHLVPKRTAARLKARLMALAKTKVKTSIFGK